MELRLLICLFLCLFAHTSHADCVSERGDFCENLYSFAQAKLKEKTSYTVLIQFGFIEQDNDPFASYAHELEIVLETAFKRCGLKERKENLWVGEIGLHQINFLISNPAPEGKYNVKLSNEEYKKFQNVKERLKEVNHIVYAGHSRFGQGMDFFPKSNGQHQTIPIYQKSFFENLPNQIEAVGILACNSSEHSSNNNLSSVIAEMGIVLSTIEKAYEPHNFINDLVCLLNKK